MRLVIKLRKEKDWQQITKGIEAGLDTVRKIKGVIEEMSEKKPSQGANRTQLKDAVEAAFFRSDRDGLEHHVQVLRDRLTKLKSFRTDLLETTSEEK